MTKTKSLLLVLIVATLLSGCKEELYGRLSENDANEIIAILLRNGLDSDKIPGKKEFYAVHVDRSQLADAIQLLKEYGYPKEQFESMGEIFKKEGLMSSPLEERSRFIYALRQNVQEMLSRIDGVLTARVNVVLPDNNPFAETLKPSSAAVFIKYHPDSTVADFKSEIKMIVSKSIEGLTYDKVSLMMVPAMTPPESSKPIPWERIFGIKISADSAGGFWLLISGFSIALCSALGLCGYLVRAMRKAQSERAIEASLTAQEAVATLPPQRPLDSIFKVVTG